MVRQQRNAVWRRREFGDLRAWHSRALSGSLEWSSRVSSRDAYRAPDAPLADLGRLQDRGFVAGRQLPSAPSLHSAGNDPVIAQIFVTMRGTLGCRVEDVAGQLGTSSATIMHLEAGHVHALPPWSETLRIIEAYGRLLGIDVGSVLDRLQQYSAQPGPLAQLERALAATGPAVAAAVPTWHPMAAIGPNGSASRPTPSHLATPRPAAASAPAARVAAHVNGMSRPLVMARLAPTVASPTRPVSPQPASSKRVASQPAATGSPGGRFAPERPAGAAAPVPMTTNLAPGVAKPQTASASDDRIATIAARLNLASAANHHEMGGSKRWRLLVAASVGAVVLSIGALVTAASTSSATGQDDASLAATVRTGFDRIAGGLIRDGLRWIEVSDPRTRKADRLTEPKK